jgi:AraC-like DNA-binding protein
VILAMRAQLDQPFSLESLADMAHASRFHFNRTFREVTGIPPFQFLYALRLDRAKQLLLTTGASVIDICYDVGYNSLGTFTRRFTELVGLSPTRLRSMTGLPLERMFDPTEGHKWQQSPWSGCITGEVEATPGFVGSIFVGLFQTAIPQSRPAACAILRQPGTYSIRGVPPDRFHVFALGLPWSTDSNSYFQYASALRGGGQQVAASAGVTSVSKIRLRPAVVTDPPILLALPWLIHESREQRLDGLAPARRRPQSALLLSSCG